MQNLPESVRFREIRSFVIAKGGDEREVEFGNAAATALLAYIEGEPLDYSIFEKYGEKAIKLKAFCNDNIHTQNIEKALKKAVSNITPGMVHDVEVAISSLRRTGRDGYSPKKNNKAVFLTDRRKNECAIRRTHDQRCRD